MNWRLPRFPGDARVLLTPLPAVFRSLDEEFGAGKYRGDSVDLLGVSQFMGPAGDWNWAAPSQLLLWQFHLHYWDWAYSISEFLPNADETTATLLASWRDFSQPGIGVAWEPYVTSLRAWTLTCLFGRVGFRTDDIISHLIADHEHAIRNRLETDIRGNHLIKNLKAIAGIDALKHGRITDAWDNAFEEISAQILSDGGHEERSPSYHVQVTADLIDLQHLASSFGQEGRSSLAEDLSNRMRTWLGVLRIGENFHLQNDGFPPSPQLVAHIMRLQPKADSRLDLLADTGIAVLRRGRWVGVLDYGPLGPDYNPGHGHADTLHVTVYAGGFPVLSEAGCSTYSVGAVRRHERSSAGHNAFVVDGRDSSEVWGRFLVGRRATGRLLWASQRVDSSEVTASHDGFAYGRSSPCVEYQRQLTMNSGGVVVRDHLTPTTNASHRYHANWYFAPGLTLAALGTNEWTIGPQYPSSQLTDRSRIVVAMQGDRISNRNLTVNTGWTGTGFGAAAPCQVLSIDIEAHGSITVVAEIISLDRK